MRLRNVKWKNLINGRTGNGIWAACTPILNTPKDTCVYLTQTTLVPWSRKAVFAHRHTAGPHPRISDEFLIQQVGGRAQKWAFLTDFPGNADAADLETAC